MQFISITVFYLLELNYDFVLIFLERQLTIVLIHGKTFLHRASFSNVHKLLLMVKYSHNKLIISNNKIIKTIMAIL